MGVERDSEALSLRVRQRKKEKKKEARMKGRMEERREGRKDGRKEGWKQGWKEGKMEGKMEGERKRENLSICRVRKGLFNPAGVCQLNVACRKRELSQRKWQSYILILATYYLDVGNNLIC